MAELAGHWAEIADLPKQPFQTLLTATPVLRHETPRSFGQMDQDGARLKDSNRPITKLLWSVVIDDCRHSVVGTDRQELGLELVAAPDIHRDHPMFEAAFLEHDGDLPPVRRRPIVEIDHARVS